MSEILVTNVSSDIPQMSPDIGDIPQIHFPQYL